MELTLEQLQTVIQQAAKDGVTASLPKQDQGSQSGGAGDLSAQLRQELDNILKNDETVRGQFQQLAQELQQAAQSKQGGDGQAEGQDQDADMAQNPVAKAVRGLDGAAGQGIPWGSALVGGFGGLVLGEVIDGFVSPTTDEGGTNFANIAVKGAAAWAAVQWGDMLVGRMGARFAAGFLIFSVARQVLPIDDWVMKIKDVFQGNGNGASSGNRFEQPIGGGGGGGGGHVGSFDQIVPGYGGAGSSPLDYVFSPR
jgi:hypothetical protein